MLTIIGCVLLAGAAGCGLGIYREWRRTFRWYDTTQKYLRGQDDTIKAHEQAAEAHRATIESLSAMCAQKDVLLEHAHGAVKRLQEMIKYSAQSLATMRLQRDAAQAELRACNVRIGQFEAAAAQLGVVVRLDGTVHSREQPPEG